MELGVLLETQGARQNLYEILLQGLLIVQFHEINCEIAGPVWFPGEMIILHGLI